MTADAMDRLRAALVDLVATVLIQVHRDLNRGQAAADAFAEDVIRAIRAQAPPEDPE